MPCQHVMVLGDHRYGSAADRLWKAQQRLHATYAKMTARGKPPGVVITAVARELAGFVWAEMTS